MRTLSLALMLIFGAVLPVLAHGGGAPQLINEPVGPYQLSAWTDPNPATVGQVHVTVALARPGTGAAITNAAVSVSAHPVSGSDPTLTAAAGPGLTPEFYEADLDIPSPGSWQFDIAVQGAEGAGAATFTLEVLKSSPNWLLIGLVGLAAVALGWMASLLLKRQTPRRHPR